MKERETERRAAVALNDDAIEEVLLRVPCCESLLRFRVVCKRWLSIIDDSRFRYRHSLRSVQRPTAFLFCSGTRLEAVRFRGGDESRSSLATEKHPEPGTTTFTTTSSHGLICLHNLYYSGEDLMVCNPTTRESLFLSQPPCRSDGFFYTSHLGFGFHPPTKEYKVAFMCGGHFQVLTVGASSTNSWRTVEHVGIDLSELHAVPFLLPPFCYNGALYFFVFHSDDKPEDHLRLLTFDLGSEEVRVHFRTIVAAEQSDDDNNVVDRMLEIDFGGFQGYEFQEVIMLRDSGRTIDAYVHTPLYYRKAGSFKMVKDHGEEGPAAAAVASSSSSSHAAAAAAAAPGPLCIEMNGILICDEEAFRSQYHLHLLEEMANGKDDRGFHIDRWSRTSPHCPVSLHAETLLSFKDL